ncbi:MAG: C25 family cysteine peptidase [Blastocatellia bacterium]
MKRVKAPIAKRKYYARLSIIVVIPILYVLATVTASMQTETSPNAFASRVVLDVGRARQLPIEKSNEKSNGNNIGGSPGQENPVASPNVVTGVTYPFTNAAGVPLEDMSSGTTLLVGASQDDTASAVTSIGFEFWFDGVRQTQFSVNANGLFGLGGVAVNNGASGRTNDFATSTNNPKMSAYWDDMCTGTAGKVHFKITGSAPNRRLVVEWLNMVQFDNVTVACSTTVRGTYQLWLFESTGVIQMVNGGTTTNDNGNGGYGVGVGSSLTSFASITPAGPTVSYAASSNANLTAIAAGTQYTLTPNVPAAPTALNFTAVTPTTMTLNWTDNASNEVGYAIYQSTDGTNFTFITQTAANATSQAVSGLTPSTTYFWRVFAVTEGALSTVLSGSQSTAAPGVVMSTAAGGPWSSTATWAGGTVPVGGDNVTIVNGATVTIDTAAVALNVTVGTGGAASVLQFDATTARTLTVGQSVTVASNGTLQSATTGTVTTHVLSVGTDLTNNGVLDLSTNANTAGANLTFTGAANNTFSGTGATTDIRTMTINKGTSSASTIDLTTSNFTVQGTVVDGTPMAFLTLTNGTLKISGTFTVAGRVFTAAAYTIGATTGIWLNNPNFTIVGQNGSPTNNGLLRVTQGTFNIGNASGNAMGAGTGAVFTIEGGTVNIAGRLLSANAVTYTQSGGTVNVCTVGNASSVTQSFGLTSATSIFNMSGGTINLVQINSNATAANRRDYSVLGTANITGGTLNVGTAATTGNAGNFDFRIGGQVPALVLNNTTNSKNVILISQMNTFGNVTVNTGCSINTGANVWLVIGTAITNNGTITVPTNLSRLYFLGTGPQTYAGSGTTTIVTAAGSVDLTVDNNAGLTIDPASNGIITQRVNFFHGGITNANKITLGNGGTTVGVIQYGLTASPDTAGNFDVAPTFNIGTGGQTLLYAQEGTTRTTGPEIPPSRTITNMTVNNTNGVILAGGDLTLTPTIATSTLTFTIGNLTTNANNVIISATSTVARTVGHVIGNLRKVYAAAGTKTFEVGTANGFSPVTANVTAGTFPANFTVKAVQGPQPNIADPTKALQRYWTLTATGVTADLTFNYLDPTDIPVTANEALFFIFKFDGSFTAPGGTVNTAANTATITGVSSFSDWTLAEPAAPTDIHLVSFTADTFTDDVSVSSLKDGAKSNSNVLRWQTGFEAANLGFNIYRDENGSRVRVTPDLVAGSALFVGARTVLGAGRSYQWRDTAGQSGPDAQYWLEEMNLNGTSTWHGPIRPIASGKRLSALGQNNSRLIGELNAGASSQDTTMPVEISAKTGKLTPARIKTQAAIIEQNAIKMAVKQEGWYRVGQPELVAAGFNPNIDPNLLQLFVDGQEQPFSVIQKDGRFDPSSAIEFYGMGLNTASADARVYWLVAGTQAGKRIQKLGSQPGLPATGGFPYAVERRDRSVYFSGLLNGEKENFFGAVIASNPVDQSLALQHLQPSGGQATLEIALQGVTLFPHRVKAQINGTDAGEIVFAGQAQGVGRFSIQQSLLKEGQNQVKLTPLAGSSDISLVDYIRVTYQHAYTADNNVLRFTATGRQQVSVDGFNNNQIRVFDITTPAAVREVTGVIQQRQSGYAITFTAPETNGRTLVALTNDQAARAAGLAINKPSSLRQPVNGADLLIISRGDFLSSLEPLRSWRQKQGLSVAMVDIEDVYDEFSYGQKSPQALKDFLLYARTSWKKAPRFVLLAADASYDPKNYLGFGNSDFVPTKLIDTQLMEAASDSWFADFDGDGVEDMAIGRLPVRNAQQALNLAAKIISYDQTQPSQAVLLVADKSDTYDFRGANGQLRELIPPTFRVEEIDRSLLDDFTAKTRLIEAISRGQKIVNYTGHGSVGLWRGGILSSDDVELLGNTQNLSLFVTMTCLNGYFADPAVDSLAESLMKADGGAMAVWASTGMTLPEGQTLMNQEAYRQLFAGGLTLGQAMAKAKAAIGNGDIRQTWILFGDPTTRLR